MTTRVKTRTVIFARPFFLDEINRELPAGSYEVETDEEPLDIGSIMAYRRVEARLFVPAIAGQSETEMWAVNPRELDAALALDREPLGRGEPDVHLAVLQSPTAARKMEELPVRNRNAMHNRNKGSNLPLYGTLLGILALLLATVAFGRRDASRGLPPPTDVAQVVRPQPKTPEPADTRMPNTGENDDAAR